jgi:tetratricopeptide (TPR) repeat protein
MLRATIDFVRSRLAPLAGLLLLCALLVPPVVADEATDRAALDQLFTELSTAPDARAANAITQRIWMIWTAPSDAERAGRMREVMAARAAGDIVHAIQLATELIGDDPDYAEAWNQRATFRYMLGDLDGAIADCEEVLKREPRHFGALSGRSLIYLQQGKRDLALRDMRAATALHPFLSERQFFPELQQPMTRI